ncbi:hypothetical protein [Acinetobacter variabilis]|uniref:Uncharacterized protein n=1 Tax=Acinetobacter variabilis TaxID=70346 RepID=N8WU70_9GAMM|nr:hypothetical protein [Acinetobacter variabilis]ENV00434.1 hypothetical protein F969_00666 [Acinetobacter variabilis]
MQPNTSRSGIGFTYKSATRTLICLGQTFTNVYPYEIETYTAAAVSHEKRTLAAEAKKRQALRQSKQPPKKVAPAAKKSPSSSKPQARKARGTKPAHSKKI